MGGVGSAVVDWLLDAQHVKPSQIVICTRRQPKTAHSRGVTVVAVDVSDRQALLSCDALRRIPDVAGIFHLAGVLDDGIVTEMDRARIQKAAKPKVSGALNLRALAVEMQWEVDWLLCFSSTSSLGGYAGQANYCAANAVLDHLAQGWGGNGDGPNVVGVNWGPWGEAGMAAVGTKAHQLSLANGELPLTNAQGLGCLATVLHTLLSSSAAAAQFTACNCEWARTPWFGMPLLQHVAPPPDLGEPAPLLAEGIADEHSEDTAVVMFLKDRVPRWELSEQLSASGLDSLDLVSMRNGFNKQFNHLLTAPTRMETFSAPTKTLRALVVELEAALAVSQL
jgi:NAD(P)-dependent dehydrogenase (short-subunit alcohol dehydrogenase family)